MALLIHSRGGDINDFITLYWAPLLKILSMLNIPTLRIKLVACEPLRKKLELEQT